MFCFRCEQAAGGHGCDRAAGVCGKDAKTAVLQDALNQASVGIAQYARRAAQKGRRGEEVDCFVSGWPRRYGAQTP